MYYCNISNDCVCLHGTYPIFTMKITLFPKVACLLAIWFAFPSYLKGQSKQKNASLIIGTWLLQKFEVRINPNITKPEEKKMLENSQTTYSKMTPKFPPNTMALIFEQGGKVTIINARIKPETTEVGSWELTGNALSIKSQGDIFRQVLVTIQKNEMEFTLISPTGQFTADTPLTMHTVFKKSSLKNLDKSQGVELPLLPPPPTFPLKERKEEPSETRNLLIIAAQKVDCEVGERKKCYQYKTDAEGKWEVLKDQIDDFGYEEGYEYVLEVVKDGIRSDVEDVNYYYTVSKVVSKTKK
jgi:Domain of unknown function (DUF4377)